MNSTKPQNSHKKVRLLIAEDHELARYGLLLALEDHGFEIVADVENGRMAVEATETHHPALILMDIGMPVLDGIGATREIKDKYPEIRVIILTSHKEDEEVYAALAAGADAYCMKDIKIERLCHVIDMVLDGVLWVDPAIARIVLSALPGTESENSVGELSNEHDSKSNRRKYNTTLTERELEVLTLIVDGKSNKEIALALGVTSHTAKAHVCNIIQKLAVDDRTQVAVKALKEGLLTSN